MITISNLTKKYGDKYALDNISFNVKKGEVLGFLGPNGAGKSTTMNIITGYISYTDGSVNIDGYDILENPIEVKKKIGYLPEIPPLYLDMVVWDYLEFVYELKKIKTEDEKSHIQQVIDMVKIDNVKNRKIAKNLTKQANNVCIMWWLLDVLTNFPAQFQPIRQFPEKCRKSF